MTAVAARARATVDAPPSRAAGVAVRPRLPPRRLPGLLRERIVVLDGAMGTMLQAYRFDEADFRGERFRDHPRDLRGNSDVLCLTQPGGVRAIHAGYLEAGADVITHELVHGDAGSPRPTTASIRRPSAS